MSETGISRPELKAHERVLRLDFPVVVKELLDVFAPRQIAYLAKVRETRAVHEWAEGTREVRNPEVERRLRFALQVALLLVDHDDRRVVQAWFQGLSPLLDDQSPGRLLREGDLEDVGPRVIAAARAFVVGG